MKRESTRRTAADFWDAVWFEEVSPHVFAVLRILFGLLGCLSLVGLMDLPLFWACDGLVASRGSAVCQQLAPMGLGWLPGALVLGFSLVAFAAMVVGYRTRVAVVCAFLAMFFLARWNDLPLSAAHQVLRNVLFCLVWADCGRVLSVDARRSRQASPSGDVGKVPIWPLRLLQIQVALIYLVTAVWKLNNVMWRDGSALHYVFENPQFRRFAILASPALDPWTTAATYVTLAWELAFAFLVFQPRTRRWTLVVGVVMHLGMWGVLELGPFSWMMLASYVAFLDTEHVRRIVTDWSARRLPARFAAS